MSACVSAPLVAGGVYPSYADVRPVLTALAELLPPELRGQDQRSLDAAWSRWAVRHDGEIRARLEGGDNDTIVNWLLFGTSFTPRPRVLLDSSSTNDAQLVQLIAARTEDLIAALQAPGTDERRLFVRRFFQRKGYQFENAVERTRVRDHLLAEVARVGHELAAYSTEVRAIRELPDATEQFALRSRLYRARGLSLDTSILPCFALDQSLQEMRSDGLLASGSVRRVAIIGPGLDFTDKSAGYDIYPQQTLQPYALLDTLQRVGLNDGLKEVSVTTFDVSPRVNDHLGQALTKARRGSPYILNVPLDHGIAWKPELVDYWKRLGIRIGTEIPTAKPPGFVGDVNVRTVSVRPAVTLQITPKDLNIVTQRDDGGLFDLIIATNVLVYYDTLDQSLALANIEAMLRPGGFLLSNNALLELPASRIRSVGYQTLQYSDRLDDGDHIVWYRRN